MKRTIGALVVLAGVIIGFVPCAQAQTITNILDNFNRDGLIAGTAPVIEDVNAGVGNTWNVSATDTVFTSSANGGEMVVTAGTVAWLPFAPQDGYVYTYSLTVKLADDGSTADRWAALGFDNGTQTQPLDAGSPWMLCKWNGEIQAFGYRTKDPIVATPPDTANRAGTNNLLQLLLDTTSPGNWKVQVVVNGTPLGSAKSLNYATNAQAIQRIGVWGRGLSTTRTSTNTFLSVTSFQPTAPVITGQPVGFTNWAGVTNTSLTVAAAGSQLAYQWYKDSTSNPLSGKTTETLAFPPLDATITGGYFAVITNSYGAYTTSVAQVTVVTSTVMALTPSISVIALPATGTDAATGLDTNYTYLSALAFRSNTTPISVNGVVFEQIDPTGLDSTNGTDSTFGGSWALSKTTVSSTKFLALTGDAAGQADGSMLTLLNDAVWLSGSKNINDDVKLTLGDLTAGTQYSLSVFFRNWDSLPAIAKFQFNGQGSNEVVTLDENIGATLNSAGAYYAKYNFTAVGSTVTFDLINTTHGRSLQLYATVLQQAVGATPTLFASRSGSSLTISWDSSVTGYTLQSSDSITGTWAPVDGVANNSVTVDASAGIQFFRLKK